MISAETPDWGREKLQLNHGRHLLSSIRGYQRNRKKPGLLPALLRKYHAIRHQFWSVVTGAEIDINATIGGGLLLPHPNGIVIHPDAVIGVNCLIFQQVTIGTREKGGVPTIEGHVYIGAGAKILGKVHIGAHAKIGANAVVIHDVAAGATAVGFPRRG